MWARVIVAILLALALGVGLVAALGIEVPGREAISGDPDSEQVGTSEEVATAYDAALGHFVHDDGVDWAGVAADPAAMRSLAALYARSGPASGSLGTDTPEGALAFRINAYNALVAFGVVEHWPIVSVNDVHGVLDPGDGFGFFRAQVFVLDRELTTLHDLAGLVLRSGDARVLALLHDGRRSSPLPRSRALRGETLVAELEASARRLATPPFVRVDAEARSVELSPLYEEHRALFESHSRSLGGLPTVLAWIGAHADERTAAAIALADREQYALRYTARDEALSSRP